MNQAPVPPPAVINPHILSAMSDYREKKRKTLEWINKPHKLLRNYVYTIRISLQSLELVQNALETKTGDYYKVKGNVINCHKQDGTLHEELDTFKRHKELFLQKTVLMKILEKMEEKNIDLTWDGLEIKLRWYQSGMYGCLIETLKQY